jgi:hypothetical protein
MYSASDYVEMLLIYGECGRNARAAARMYAQRFPNRNHPDHKVILSAIATFYQIGRKLVGLPGLYALLKTNRLF